MIFDRPLLAAFLALSASVHGHTIVRVSCPPSPPVADTARLTIPLLCQSIWVNGVDQGTGVGMLCYALYQNPPASQPASRLMNTGIRTPANNGPIGPGYNSSPVKNLTSIDLRCNLLGDSPAADTIVVAPGDTVSFEW